ncbi:hypothetical protein CEQ90_17350 [Lewinellaceae bacterium SD302]|nr:hypothetical protein CEQ90_17350 [Lewinellaceae bacterium SD302]
MTYPEKHYDIIKALFSEGRFLIEGETAFHCLRDHQEFYQQFFRETFRLDLNLKAEYALLKSSKDTDDLARSICIFLAVMCYELDQDSGNLLEMLAFNTFSISEWEERFEQSSFHNVLEATDKLRSKSQRLKFYQQINRRRLINRLDDDRFQFTAAHRYFLEFARDVNMQEMVGKIDA